MGEGVVDRLVAESRAEACAAGRKLALVYEAACSAPVAEFAAVEVACALTLSRFAAENLVQLATALCERLPTVLTALSNGDLDLHKTRIFTEVLADLDVDTARSVAALVLPKAPSSTAGQLRDILRRKAIAADPAYTATRRSRAASLRCVQLNASDDGTASLTAFGLDTTRAAAAMQRITAIARQRHYAGDPTQAAQLRADVLLELLEGKHENASRGVINLTVSLETLAHFHDDPASLGGYGPIAADIARQWIAQHPGYQWSYAVHDSSGMLLQQGLTRPPEPSQARTGATASPADRKPQRAADTNRPDSGAAASPGHAQGTNTGRAGTGTGRADAGDGRHRTKTSGGESGNRQHATKTSGAEAGDRRHATKTSGAEPGDRRHGTKTSDTESGTRGQRTGAPAGSDTAKPPAQDPHDRTANAAMTRWIRLRDETCRIPGCRMPAAQCDLDHTRRHNDGGPTTHDNLGALCRHHHRTKEEGGWRLIQTRPGHFTWTSPMGRIYEIGPEPP